MAAAQGYLGSKRTSCFEGFVEASPGRAGHVVHHGMMWEHHRRMHPRSRLPPSASDALTCFLGPGGLGRTRAAVVHVYPSRSRYQQDEGSHCRPNTCHQNPAYAVRFQTRGPSKKPRRRVWMNKAQPHSPTRPAPAIYWRGAPFLTTEGQKRFGL